MQDKYARSLLGVRPNIIPIFLYSDESSVTLEGFSFHPLQIYLGLPLHLMRTKHNYRRLALLPTLQTRQMKLSQEEEKEYGFLTAYKLADISLNIS